MKTILQVEDDPNDIFLLRHAMKRADLLNPVQVVTNGRDAIDYLKGEGPFADREKFPLPSLILLDLKLPYVMGLDVLQWTRLQPELNVIIIVLTASGQETDAAAAYRLGANAFLVKPTEARKLVDMVRAIKDFWLTHNLPPAEISRPSSGTRPMMEMMSGGRFNPGLPPSLNGTASGNR